MIGSLASLAAEFPQTNLQLETLTPLMLSTATGMEAALFAGFVTAALLWSRRLSQTS
jgi:hypothetical protein